MRSYIDLQGTVAVEKAFTLSNEDRSDAMRAILKTAFAALALSSALAGVALAEGTTVVPVAPSAGPYYVDGMPAGSVYVDPAPTGSVYVDPMPSGSIYVAPAPRRIYLTPSEFRERQRNEYQSGGEGDYYQGIIPPAPVP